jgi:hypothetical protein
VPTGIKIGVSTSPCGRESVPARADPSVALRVKGIRKSVSGKG